MFLSLVHSSFASLSHTTSFSLIAKLNHTVAAVLRYNYSYILHNLPY